jgi:hypothetical protein
MSFVNPVLKVLKVIDGFEHSVADLAKGFFHSCLDYGSISSILRN